MFCVSIVGVGVVRNCLYVVWSVIFVDWDVLIGKKCGCKEDEVFGREEVNRDWKSWK